MILIVCTDDEDITNAALQSARDSAAVFGRVFDLVEAIQGQHSPGPNEDLFITGHGTYRESDQERNAVIGDELGPNFVNGIQLAEILAGNDVAPGLLPAVYNGRIFLDVC